jgi:hypothetical protein
LLVVVILGSVWLYLAFVASVPVGEYEPRERAAEGVFAVELTLTFDAELDAFALEPDASPVELNFQGRNLVAGKGPFRRGEPIRISPVAGIVEAHGEQSGRNSFVFRAIPKPSEADPFSVESTAPAQLAHAARIRIFRDDQLVGEQTLWSEPGQPVSGTVEITVVARETVAHDEHE